MGPWLQAKVADGEKQLLTESSQIHQAKEERDAAKAMLTEAQRMILQLEKQYASAVQELTEQGTKTDDETGVNLLGVPVEVQQVPSNPMSEDDPQAKGEGTENAVDNGDGEKDL